MRVVVDAEGYRERRAEALERQAEQAADERAALRAAGRARRDERQRAQARARVPARRADVETHSEGDEPDRHLVVAPCVA